MEFSQLMKEVGAVGIHFEKMMPEIEIKAMTGFPILIVGETGTGKELVAKLIHRMSKRSDKPLQFVNVPAINNGVFESELFGHEKGAFTDASKARKGVIREIHGGTIVLDEIGDMSLETQAKILRWLESGEIKPVGSDRVLFVDVRVIASTNKKLENLIESGLFRQDLYYRLSSLSIEVSPLRKSQEAILDLTKYFVDKNKKHFVDFRGNSLDDPSGSELAKLFSELIEANAHCSNFLSGNARELESVVKEWLFKRALNYNKEKNAESLLSTYYLDNNSRSSSKPESSNDDNTKVCCADEESALVTNIRKALILCKWNTKNAAILLECSEEELQKIIEDNNIFVEEGDNYSISREDVKPIKSFSTDNQHQIDVFQNASWLKKINCNFAAPSNNELKEIHDILERKIAEVEKEVFQMAINHFNGNLRKATRSLGIGDKRLKAGLEKYNISAVSGVQLEANPGPLNEILLTEENKLIKFLLIKNMTAKNIAKILGYHINAVYCRIKRYNLKEEE